MGQTQTRMSSLALVLGPRPPNTGGRAGNAQVIGKSAKGGAELKRGCCFFFFKETLDRQ